MSRRSFLAAAGMLVLAPTIPERFSPVQTTSSDADLIALCDRFASLNDEFHRLVDLQDAVPQPITDATRAEWDRIDDLVCSITCQFADLERQISSRPATTGQGIRAKARAALFDMTAGRGPSGDLLNDENAIAYSLARDVLETEHPDRTKGSAP